MTTRVESLLMNGVIGWHRPKNVKTNEGGGSRGNEVD